MNLCSRRSGVDGGLNQIAHLIAAICLLSAVVTPINGFLCSKPIPSSSCYLFTVGNRVQYLNGGSHCLSMSAKPSDETKNLLIDDFSWRVEKVRLEEANKKRFLRRKPIKMSYADSQKWIQRNWAPETQQEFEDLVENGNLRTPYISKRPEEYYGERGEWISWDHYLLGDCSSELNRTHDLKWQ